MYRNCHEVWKCSGLSENDWFYAWYIAAILQFISEFCILRPERRFKLQKILSDAPIKNEVLDHIKVNDMHWNGVSPLPEPWPSSWTYVCVICFTDFGDHLFKQWPVASSMLSKYYWVYYSAWSHARSNDMSWMNAISYKMKYKTCCVQDDIYKSYTTAIKV